MRNHQLDEDHLQRIEYDVHSIRRWQQAPVYAALILFALAGLAVVLPGLLGECLHLLQSWGVDVGIPR